MTIFYLKLIQREAFLKIALCLKYHLSLLRRSHQTDNRKNCSFFLLLLLFFYVKRSKDRSVARPARFSLACRLHCIAQQTLRRDLRHKLHPKAKNKKNYDFLCLSDFVALHLPIVTLIPIGYLLIFLL